MNKTDQTRPGFTQYGQISCITPGCNEPPLSPKKLCASCQWPDAPTPKPFVEPVDEPEDVRDTRIANVVTALEPDVAPNTKPKKRQSTAGQTDDEKRAIRLARSKAWHAKQKALKQS